MLTKEIQVKFIEKNFNKPVIYFSNIGRLVGYVESKQGYYNVIAFGFGHKEQLVYIDAGLRLIFVEPENPLFKDINESLSLNGNPEKPVYLFQDLCDDILFNSSGLEYLKNHSTSLFNQLVQIDKDLVRMIGYCADDFGNSYICLDINNNKKYFDSLCKVKKIEVSDSLYNHLEETINKLDELLFENFQSEE